MSLWFHLKYWVISQLCERSLSHAVSVVNWWWRERKQLMSLCMHESIPVCSCGSDGVFLRSQLKDSKTQSELRKAGTSWEKKLYKSTTKAKGHAVWIEYEKKVILETVKSRRERKWTLLSIMWSCNPPAILFLSFLPPPSSGTPVSLCHVSVVGEMKIFCVFLHSICFWACVCVSAFMFFACVL